jgi:hypothetical protein
MFVKYIIKKISLFLDLKWIIFVKYKESITLKLLLKYSEIKTYSFN